MKPGKFSGGFGGLNMNALMKQAQKMQQDIMSKKEELNEREYSGSAGGGTVNAVVRGTNELKSITIDPEAVSPDDVEMLQDMIIAAVNEALKVAKSTEEEEMKAMTGGIDMPL